jgi:hypothetical protein
VRQWQERGAHQTARLQNIINESHREYDSAIRAEARHREHFDLAASASDVFAHQVHSRGSEQRSDVQDDVEPAEAEAGMSRRGGGGGREQKLSGNGVSGLGELDDWGAHEGGRKGGGRGNLTQCCGSHRWCSDEQQLSEPVLKGAFKCDRAGGGRGGGVHWDVERLSEWHQEIQDKYCNRSFGGERQQQPRAHEQDVGQHERPLHAYYVDDHETCMALLYYCRFEVTIARELDWYCVGSTHAHMRRRVLKNQKLPAGRPYTAVRAFIQPYVIPGHDVKLVVRTMGVWGSFAEGYVRGLGFVCRGLC